MCSVLACVGWVILATFSDPFVVISVLERLKVVVVVMVRTHLCLFLLSCFLGVEGGGGGKK